MHDIEPHFQWRAHYRAESDPQSPFYGRQYSEFEFSARVYNYYIHPQWDAFGSSTLYTKLLFADYDEGYAILEFIGEWNDTLHNDVMYLKREVIDLLIPAGIHKYILIMEGVLNFHGDDDAYYEEWYDEVREEGGWIAMLNTLKHVEMELYDTRLDHYLAFGGVLNDINWRPQKPRRVYEAIEGLVQRGAKRVY